MCGWWTVPIVQKFCFDGPAKAGGIVRDSVQNVSLHRLNSNAVLYMYVVDIKSKTFFDFRKNYLGR
jgi:hypothetical protein